MQHLLKTAQIHDARVLFVGDVRQHVSVEAGDFLRVLEQHSKLRCSELQDIRRQIPADYNRAIRLMARGDVSEGLERLDQLGCIHEGKGDYLRQAAAAYVDATRKGESLDRCIAIAPTWDENHRLTEAIREQLKQSGRLHSPTQIQIQDPLDWTTQQRAEARSYKPGMVVTLTRRAGRFEPGQSLVVERVEPGRLYFQNSSEPLDPAKHADKLQVATTRQIELATGDPILIRRNARKLGLVNGEVLTCASIQSDGSIQTREGKILPPTFRDFCHGYVVTSHKSQGRTHDQVIVAAQQLDAKAAYVACSRGRHQASIFTPDKARLFDGRGTIRRPVGGFGCSRSDSFAPCDLAATGTASLAEGSRTGFAPTEDHRETRTYDRARTRDSPSIEKDPMAGSASAFIGTGDQSMSQIPVTILRPKPSEPRFDWSSSRLRPVHQECRMTSQCYLPRSSQRSAIGAVFVTIGGVRRFIPDHFLTEAELSEQGRLLRLIYTCCTVEVAGQRLEVLFEDAIVGRLGTILQAPPASCLVISRG